MQIKIKDLGLAAALSSLGFEIEHAEKDTKGRTHFIFSDTPEVQVAVSSYWANTLDVKARYYFDAIKMLKSRIYGDK